MDAMKIFWSFRWEGRDDRLIGIGRVVISETTSRRKRNASIHNTGFGRRYFRLIDRVMSAMLEGRDGWWRCGGEAARSQVQGMPCPSNPSISSLVSTDKAEIESHVKVRRAVKKQSSAINPSGWRNVQLKVCK